MDARASVSTVDLPPFRPPFWSLWATAQLRAEWRSRCPEFITKRLGCRKRCLAPAALLAEKCQIRILGFNRECLSIVGACQYAGTTPATARCFEKMPRPRWDCSHLGRTRKWL